MELKTLLVHLDAAKACPGRIALAAALARRFGAFLRGLYVDPPVDLPAVAVGRGASSVVLAGAREQAERSRETVERAFRAACEAGGVAGEFQRESGDATEALAQRLLYADLAIVSRMAHDLEDALFRYPPDHLAMVADGPVLVLPEAESVPEPGRAVLVAWKPRREAGRAVRLARPFLVRAERVVVLTVGEDVPDHEPGRELCAHLARLGVKAEHRRDHAEDSAAGLAIEAHAQDMGADLVVMGAYGRSRFRELVLGGATRHALRRMRRALLVAH